MKRLSDYTGDEAIELWADLLEPISKILGDEQVKASIQGGESKMKIAQKILKDHKAEAVDILTRIDDSPVNGLNLILRVVNLLTEFSESDEIKSFFGYAEQIATTKESPISATENTEVEEN